MAGHAWGQETPVGARRGQPGLPGGEPGPIFPSPGPAIASYPLELLGLLAPSAQRGPITLLPSIAVSEEYNDNVFLNNQNRQWDFITGVSPGIMLFVNRPSYRLSGGYTFTAEMYDRESRLSNAFKHQNFIFNGVYEGTRGLSLTVSDAYALNRDTNLVASQGFSTGRQESWSNTFAPGMTWQMTPRTSLNLVATYGVQRFEGSGTGLGSDSYGLQSKLGYGITPSLTGTVGYGFTYLNLEAQENSTTHTPTLGLSYRLTPTLTANVSGGPAITELGGKTFVSPAATASLVQAFRFGSASLQYTRGVGVAGGFGGTTDSQSISGAIALITLLRGLIVTFSPTYNTAESVSRGQTGRVDTKALTLSLGASYQVARFVSVFGGYTFFQQRTGASSSQQFDADQNVVRFGVQFGYPINFD